MIEFLMWSIELTLRTARLDGRNTDKMVIVMHMAGGNKLNLTSRCTELIPEAEALLTLDGTRHLFAPQISRFGISRRWR
jgi:hypothetical protein